MTFDTAENASLGDYGDYSLAEKLVRQTIDIHDSGSEGDILKIASISAYGNYANHFADLILAGGIHNTQISTIITRFIFALKRFDNGGAALGADYLPIPTENTLQRFLDRSWYWPSPEVLDLGGAYAPDPELISFWIEGVSEFDAAAAEGKQLLSLVGRSELSNGFGQRLRGTLASFADRHRSDNDSVMALTDTQRLDPNFQVQLADRFWIAPDRCLDFMSLVVKDLLANLSRGAKIDGDWGNLAIVNGELLLELAPLVQLPADGFVYAERVE